MSKKMKRLAILAVVLILVAVMLPTEAMAATSTDAIPNITISDTKGNVSESNGTVTVTATGGTLSRATNTVTIANTYEGKLMLKFDYALSNAYNYTNFAGTTSSAYDGSTSGTYTATLENDDTITFSFTSLTKSLGQATFTLSNFTATPILPEATVTVTANRTPSYGYVTVDGEVLSNYSYKGTSVTVTDAGMTFKAVSNTSTSKTTINGTSYTGNTNNNFAAWVDADTYEILSLSTSYTVVPTKENIKIKAIFGRTNVTAFFQVGDTLYEGLGKALEAYEAGVGNVITLRNNGSVLANEEHTIPEGCTLLIPFDAAGTVYTTAPASTSSTTSPSAYRTLYVRSGAKLTINGTLSVSAKHRYAHGGRATGCVVSGKFGRIAMYDGSSIVVNGGLYCYGYIQSASGTNSVVVNDGAEVYELFQLEDFRGGNQTFTKMENEVFPFSQYFVQNVQVPMTLHYGATEYAYITLYLNKSAFSRAISFIGSANSFVTLQEGAAITKSYDVSTDRLTIALEGNCSVSNFSLSMSLYTFDTANYVMPITSNMTLKVASGTASVNQDIALLPGSRVEIGEGATVTLASGTRIYVYDQDEWGNYCWDRGADIRNVPFQVLRYAYGRTYTRTEADLIDAAVLINGTLDASAGAIYTTESGANIYSTDSGEIILASGSETVTYQLIQGYTETTTDEETEEDTDDDTESVEHPNEYVAIPITSAQLLNGDGSYVETADGGNNTYTYVDGFWRCTTHSYGTEGAYTEGRGDSTVPSYAEDDCLTYTCSVCNHTKQEDLKMSFAIYATNVRAGDGLDIFFYINKTAVGDGTGLVAKIVRTRCGVADAPQDIPFSDWTTYGTDLLRFSYSGIAAKEMTDEVYVKIYRDGVQVCSVQVESVQSYALRALGTEKNELSTALVDMLNYGAAAQNTFTYNTGDLANAGLNETQQGFATQSTTYSYSTLVKSEDLAAASVSATNKLMLTFYYYTDLTANGYTAHITYTDHYGTEQTRTINSFTERTLEGITVYGVDVTGLAIADGRQLITCVIKDSNGEEVSTSVCSVENYVAKTIEQAGDAPDPVYELLMKFVDSAYAYFH